MQCIICIWVRVYVNSSNKTGTIMCSTSPYSKLDIRLNDERMSDIGSVFFSNKVKQL